MAKQPLLIKIQSVSIIDISGKAAKTVLPQDKKDKISINFSELPTGSYILIINTEKGKFSKKIIKE
ncbi:T9SS type A sorting domain-containing protein [Chryseobacterium sp. MYb264]|uniref:T9SS type A sorting domain-containing protein n=1 Tax=Chryseobacterium sp. MYb264 TaxID=2745153 RepID=UPI002E107D79|nr:T9SS type A sorting domain-containing protein [Chryseobacterium sp. MYb264]